MIVNTSSYGLCLVSIHRFQNFLKLHNKSRVKKVLDLFEANHDLYLNSLAEGAWIPIPNISSINYEIELVKDKNDFIYEYKNFNLEVKDDLWICDIGSFFNFNILDFENKTIASYQTLDGKEIVYGFKIPIDDGKYHVSIFGSNNNNIPILSFKMDLVDEFLDYEDPRDDKYKFNLVNKN